MAPKGVERTSTASSLSHVGVHSDDTALGDLPPPGPPKLRRITFNHDKNIFEEDPAFVKNLIVHPPIPAKKQLQLNFAGITHAALDGVKEATTKKELMSVFTCIQQDWIIAQHDLFMGSATSSTMIAPMFWFRELAISGRRDKHIPMSIDKINATAESMRRVVRSSSTQ
jgi:hypothetical protein